MPPTHQEAHMDHLTTLVTATMPDAVTAAEILAAAELTEPVTMRTEPDPTAARSLVRGRAPIAATLARNTRDADLLAELAKHRALLVQHEVACNPATPVNVRAATITALRSHHASRGNHEAYHQLTQRIVKSDDIASHLALANNHVELAETLYQRVLQHHDDTDRVAAYRWLLERVAVDRRHDALRAFARWCGPVVDSDDGYHGISPTVLAELDDHLDDNDAFVILASLTGINGRLHPAVLERAAKRSTAHIDAVLDKTRELAFETVEWLEQHRDVAVRIARRDHQLAAHVLHLLGPQHVDVLVAAAHHGAANRYSTTYQTRHTIAETYRQAVVEGHTPSYDEVWDLYAVCDTALDSVIDVICDASSDDDLDQLVTSTELTRYNSTADRLATWFAAHPETTVPRIVAWRRETLGEPPKVLRTAARKIIKRQPEHVGALCDVIPVLVNDLDDDAARHYLEHLAAQHHVGDEPSLTGTQLRTVVERAARTSGLQTDTFAWALYHGDFELTSALLEQPAVAEAVRDAIELLGDDTGGVYDSNAAQRRHGANTFSVERERHRQPPPVSVLASVGVRLAGAHIEASVIAATIDRLVDTLDVSCADLFASGANGVIYLAERYARVFPGDGDAWRTALQLSHGSVAGPATIERSVNKLCS